MKRHRRAQHDQSSETDLRQSVDIAENQWEPLAAWTSMPNFSANHLPVLRNTVDRKSERAAVGLVRLTCSACIPFGVNAGKYSAGSLCNRYSSVLSVAIPSSTVNQGEKFNTPSEPPIDWPLVHARKPDIWTLKVLLNPPALLVSVKTMSEIPARLVD